MTTHEQQEKRRKLALQALEDVIAERADLAGDGVWRFKEGKKTTPWNREAKRQWRSKDLLLQEYHRARIEELERKARSAGHDLSWYEDRVCDGCTTLHTDDQGKPYLDHGGQPRLVHEFHVTAAEWAEMQEKHLQAEQALTLAYEERDVFVLGLPLAPPRELYEAFDQDQRTGVGASLAKIAAGDLEFSGGVFSVGMLQKRLIEMETSIRRDEAILAGQEPDHGLLSRRDREENLARNRPNLAFGRWLLATHADKLVVR